MLNTSTRLLDDHKRILDPMKLRTTKTRTVRLSKNKTGLPGVSRYHNDYVARIRYGKRELFLGYYATAHAAFEAYLKAARELGIKIRVRK